MKRTLSRLLLTCAVLALACNRSPERLRQHERGHDTAKMTEAPSFEHPVPTWQLYTLNGVRRPPNSYDLVEIAPTYFVPYSPIFDTKERYALEIEMIHVDCWTAYNNSDAQPSTDDLVKDAEFRNWIKQADRASERAHAFALAHPTLAKEVLIHPDDPGPADLHNCLVDPLRPPFIR